jgi:hypothetical protein
VQAAGGEINVAPTESEQLADAQAGEGERGEDGVARRRLVGAGLAIELGRRVQQGVDVAGLVDVGAARTRHPKLAPALTRKLASDSRELEQS